MLTNQHVVPGLFHNCWLNFRIDLEILIIYSDKFIIRTYAVYAEEGIFTSKNPIFQFF